MAGPDGADASGSAHGTAAATARLVDQLIADATWLDGCFTVPGTQIRFGWDPVIGIVPIAGDIVGAVLGARLILRARALGLGKATTAQMLLNVGVDFAIGAIPFIGPVFDAFYRSNRRNVALVIDDLARRHANASPNTIRG